MGEAEGKKDEADYKRLQTFPLVRVSPSEGGSGPGAHAASEGGKRWWGKVRRACWLRTRD